MEYRNRHHAMVKYGMSMCALRNSTASSWPRARRPSNDLQSTKKSGMKFFVPGVTEYFSRSVTPWSASTSSSI